MKIKKYTNLPLLIIGIIFVPIVLLLISGYTFSENLNEPIQLEQDAEFIYHIDVIYDDINANLLEYSDNSIYVEDILPNDLTFIKFQTDGVITDPNHYCGAYTTVKNYDENTRKISFNVNGLSDRCVVRVGILVKTGTTNTRVDHYNTAKATYKGEQYNSLSVHSYIGNENQDLKRVSYSFNGIPNDKLNTIPSDKYYSVGQEVTLEEPEKVFGYKFLGWTSNDVTITDNTFTMPNTDVTIVGNYESLNYQKYKVTYKIEGYIPKEFILPETKEYYETESVPYRKNFSSEIYYNIYDEQYMFSDIVFSNNVVKIGPEVFVMPNSDVTVTIIFEKVPYFITYNFLGNIIPKNAELPQSSVNNVSNLFSFDNTERLSTLKNYNFIDVEKAINDSKNYYGLSAHYFGDKVNLVKDYKSTICTNLDTDRTVRCRFLGWLYNDEFNMPSHHLNIYGTWMEIAGTFEPEITVEITNPKDYYEKDEVVEFKTTIKNTSDVDIKDLVIENKFNDQIFVESNNYSVKENLITIPELKANQSIELFSSYVVGENSNREFTNELEIISAKAENEYYLENSDYSASTNFETRKVGDSTPISNNTNNTNTTNDTVIEKNETVPTETNNTPNNESTVPKTSDNAYIYILLLVGSLILIIAIVIVFIKNKKNK